MVQRFSASSSSLTVVASSTRRRARMRVQGTAPLAQKGLPITLNVVRNETCSYTVADLKKVELMAIHDN